MNRKRTAFTLIELLVVISVIAVLMAILMPALKRAREQGQRAVCVSTVKQLTLCWLMYADDNDDRLVNGEAGIDWTDRATHTRERYWVGQCWDQYNVQGGRQLTRLQQTAAIQAGVFWIGKYVPRLDAFACPTGIRDEMLTYNIMDGVNGMPREPGPTAAQRPPQAPTARSSGSRRGARSPIPAKDWSSSTKAGPRPTALPCTGTDTWHLVG